ncbi:medium-chain acyl-CoA ligase ACSF2, mitochondrial-like [Ochlerotatus camptorhynchus]|uniref:medium-chain acyl-CoA ligase ACSF2, mitochondrial-like n=1 Tax=Ochlerotatus camptorhynchus TaxID=644619 RepID=UPI0031DF5705
MISVGINPAYQAPELEYALNKVGVKALIAPESYRSQNYYDMINQIVPELKSCSAGEINSSKVPSLSAVIMESDRGQTLTGTIPYEDLFQMATEKDISHVESLQNSISPDSGVNLQFTSGTTGQPKAALLSHFNFINNVVSLGLKGGFELSEQHRVCIQVPFFHVFGVVIGILGSITHGCTLVVPGPGFKASASAQAIVNERCNVIYGTPTMYVDLVSEVRKSDIKLPPIKLAVTGGAPCSPQLFTDIQGTLGVEQVKTIYGLTETTAMCFHSFREESQENIRATVGHLGDHWEAKVVDGEGKLVPYGTPGELCIRGYGTMLGYWEDETKTRETIGADKWLKTGDQFVLREDGYGQIVGRIKEVVIRGGENVYPKEIEDFLSTHPDVLEVHCVGVPDERMGEEVCAFVRLNDGGKQLDRAGVKEFCTGKLAHFKVPKYVEVVEDFPKTTSGKIQKFKLVERFMRNKV